MKNKFFKKLFCLYLVVLLTINPLAVKIAYAEEEEIPSVVEVVETETQSTIETGDADASAETQTEVNTTIDTIPGELTVPEGDCTVLEGQTSCEEDVEIANNNTAEVETDSNSLANTGENEISGSAGDAVIDTGDATAFGEVDTQVNTSEVILDPSPVEEPAETKTEEEGSSQILSIENTNDGVVENLAEVSASTGGNTASDNKGDVQVLTGDALALANILNFLNTNIVGSNFEIMVLDIDGSSQIIDLNQLWKDISEKGSSDSLSFLEGSDPNNLSVYVRNTNEADLTNNITVFAESGNNQADNNQSVEIGTGDATALANVVNLANTNIVGAKFFLGIINFLTNSDGDLILPRPENFSSSGNDSSGIGGVEFNNQNTAVLNNNVVSLADSGSNQSNTNSDCLIDTGEAVAIANSFSLINADIWRNDWFYLLINNLGDWSGSVYGWDSSSGAQSLEKGSQTFEIDGYTENTGENFGNELVFRNENTATIENNILVSASTGSNQANENYGESSIKTGSATAISNLFNLINTNILGGRWFMGIINILGKWTGNIVFAYPDVEVTLEGSSSEVEIGQTTNFSVHYQNTGYDIAKDVKVQVQLPAGFRYLSDFSGLPAVVSGQTVLWSVGNLEIGEEGNISILVEVDPNFNFNQSLSFWQKIIRPVLAAENSKEKEVQITARIETSDPESDFNNNSFSTITLVYQSIAVNSGDNNTGDEGIDQRQPKLEITSWNNVNDFVYPGDTVTFEITIANTSDVPSYNTVIEQNLFNGMPEEFGSAIFNLGTVEPGRKGILSFGLKMPDKEIEAGPYRAIARAYGKATNGNEISSNEARSNFNIKFRFIPQVEAIMPEEFEGQVLGAFSETGSSENQRNIWPFVILFSLSSLWLVEKNRGILREKKLYVEK